MPLKEEFQCNDDCEENAATTAATDTFSITPTASDIKIELEETILKSESHCKTLSSSELANDGEDSFVAYNCLLSRMDDLLQNVPKLESPRSCFYLRSLLLQCPACAKGYKGGEYGLPSLLNHIKVHHWEMRSRLVKVVRQRYTARNKCDCFACYVNRASKNPKERIPMFNNLSGYSKSVVLKNFLILKGALESQQ